MKIILFLSLIFFQGASSHVFENPCPNTASYSGKYQVIRAYENGKIIFVPKKRDAVTMELFGAEDGDSDYEVSIVADNAFATSLNITGKADDCYDTIDLGLVSSTAIWPRKQYQPIEDFISNHFENMDMMRVYEKSVKQLLVMKGANATLVSKYLPPPDEYKGQWKLLSVTDNGTSVPLPYDKDVIMEFKHDMDTKDKQSYKWSTEVSNSLFTNVNIIGTEIIDDDEYDMVEVGPNMGTTLMVPAAGDEALENFFGTSFLSMTMMYIDNAMEDESDILIMSSGTAEVSAERYVPTHPMHMGGYAGKWTLTSAMQNGVLIEYPDDLAVPLLFMPQPGSQNKYTFNAKAVNTFFTDMDIIGETDDGAYDKIDMGAVASTKKGYSDEYAAIEGFFQKALEEMMLMASNEGRLVMKGENVELHAVRGASD